MPLDLLAAIVAAVVAVVILVTGATGQISSELVRLLADRGAPARALVHSPAKAPSSNAWGWRPPWATTSSPTPWLRR